MAVREIKGLCRFDRRGYMLNFSRKEKDPCDPAPQYAAKEVRRRRLGHNDPASL